MNGNDDAFATIRRSGLSKREYIATEALAGLMHQHTMERDSPYYAKKAVRFADDLIKELDKKVLCEALAKRFNNASEATQYVECLYKCNDDRAFALVSINIPVEVKERDKVIDNIESKGNFIEWIMPK